MPPSPSPSHPPFLTTQDSLLHAAVAYASNKRATLDALLVHSTATPILPPELILQVRAHLQHIQSDQIAATSSEALARYEYAAASRYCAECTAYNQHVFGPDVWSWFEAGVTEECACRTVTPSGALPDRPPEPKEFEFEGVRAVRTRRDWLYAHLSLVYLAGKDVSTHVDSVLSSFGCEAVPRKHLPPSSGVYAGVTSMGGSRKEHAASKASLLTPMGSPEEAFGPLLTLNPVAGAAHTVGDGTVQSLMRELCISPHDASSTRNNSDRKMNFPAVYPCAFNDSGPTPIHFKFPISRSACFVAIAVFFAFRLASVLRI
ncbi:hypothetical protein BD410DRAFT_799472 [Rickenella mellea]|uniref:Uncharacterized protein n=1 Tax=Rickenella mellea TaxID=50990 RepID=A0A4Y7QLM9_9AGAM|nr:hypothetical protein BD410DRAFT_799472 [Rickenella mellea]